MLRKLKVDETLMVAECDNCMGTLVCIDYPPGWLEVTEFQLYSEHNLDDGEHYATGEWLCPKCASTGDW